MENRNRNTAILLICAGLFILLGETIGYYTIAGFVLMAFGFVQIRSRPSKWGYIFLVVGAVLLVFSNFLIILAVVLGSLGYFFIRSKQVYRDESYKQKQNIVGSVKWDTEPWVLNNVSMWHVVGEITIDVSLALPESQETTIILQGIVGDIHIIVPEDYGLRIESLVVFGQLDVNGERESGLFNKMAYSTPDYDKFEHRVRFLVSYLVGDIDIKVI